jgi:exodeoxyribonuclease-5
MDIPSQRERMQAVRRDPYYNALQIKFAYALTCHKSQGGQWERVFIDKGVVAEDTSLISYLRWLYTALTRTTDRVYLVNWPKSEQIVIEEEDEDC